MYLPFGKTGTAFPVKLHIRIIMIKISTAGIRSHHHGEIVAV